MGIKNKDSQISMKVSPSVETSFLSSLVKKSSRKYLVTSYRRHDTIQFDQALLYSQKWDGPMLIHTIIDITGVAL
jgi:hypothetical protein